MKRALAPIAAAICVGALGAPLCANAHHSFFGRFDTGTVTEIEGEVTELLWRNPHAYLRVHAVDANGVAPLSPSRWCSSSIGYGCRACSCCPTNARSADPKS